jgi:hypothetical protein
VCGDVPPLEKEEVAEKETEFFLGNFSRESPSCCSYYYLNHHQK